MFTAALSTAAKLWGQPKGPSGVSGRTAMGHSHSGGLPGREKEETLTPWDNTDGPGERCAP